MKRTLATLLVAAMALCVVDVAPARGAQEGDTEAAGEVVMDTGGYEWEWMADTSPHTFEVWWADVWPWAKPAVGWEDKPVVRLVEEKTGISIDYTVPVGQQDEMIGPMLASGDLPHTMVITPFNSPYIAQMEQAGLIHSLTNLMDQYAPKMKTLMSPDQTRFHSSEDGELYKWVGFIHGQEAVDAYKSIDYPPTFGGKVLFVRQDILSDFGKEDISTLDEFVEILRLIKQQYPDTVPLAVVQPEEPLLGSLGANLAPTFGIHPSGLYPNNGRIELLLRDPKYVDMLRFLNGLFREGLISANQLTETQQHWEEKIFSGRYGTSVGAIFHMYNTINLTIEENTGDSEKTYQSVGPMIQQGIPWEVPSVRNKGHSAYVITKNAPRPDRIIRFLEYTQTEEGQTDMLLGVEDLMWEMQGGKPVMKPSVVEEISASLEDYVMKYGVIANWIPWARAEYWALYIDDYLIPAGPIRQELWQRLGPYVVNIWDDGFVDLKSSFPIGSPLDVSLEKVEDATTEAATKLITARNDAEFNSIYDQSIATINQLGATEVEDGLTAEYERQLEILGK